MTNEERQAYDRRYYTAHREKLKARQRRYTRLHLGIHAATQRRYRERWPDRDAASRERQDVKRIVKRVILQRVFV